jgi:uncharacterized protein YdeI (BOF family)
MRRENQLLLISAILIGSFLMSKQLEGKVLISKIQISGVSTTDEYVELYNFSSSSENLSGWKLTKQTSGGSVSNLVSSFPQEATISPFGYFLVAHRDYPGRSDLLYSNASVSIAPNNSVELFDPNAVLADKTTWTDIEPNTNLVRLPNDILGNYLDTDTFDDFVTSTDLPRNTDSSPRPTPETITPPITEPEVVAADWSKVIINEVVPNPTTGNEWVELYNNNSSSIDISGGTLCDGRSEVCTIATLSGTISENGFLVIEISGSKLNNDGDLVILKDPSGNVVDTLDYFVLVPDKGQALARSSDKTWTITESLTPNALNILKPPAPKEVAVTVGGGGSGFFSSILETKPAPQIIKTGKEPTVLWSLKVPSVVIQNSSTLFDAHLSADPRGGELLYSWQFGEGANIEGARVYHSFASSGIYFVTVSATSTQGTVGSKRFELKVDGGFEKIMLSEIMVKPTPGEDEWVSLQSFTTSSVDLGGWKIGVGSGKWFTIPSKTIIEPGRSLRFYKTATRLSFIDGGGSVLLSNKDGTVIDILEYGKATRNLVISSEQPIETTTPATKPTPKKLVLGVKSYGCLPVAGAKELNTNTNVCITGIVKSLPGKPYANYFYIQDDSGGIQIYSYKKDFPKLALGDRVRVNGQIGTSSGETRVRTGAGGIIRISEGTEIEGQQKTVDEISSEDSGTLVSVEGEITKLKSSLLYLDDGAAELAVTLPQKANIDRAALKEGLTVRVTGIVVQNNGGIRLVPRSSDDIKLIVAPASGPKKDPTLTKTIFGAGGVALVGLAAALKKFFLK